MGESSAALVSSSNLERETNSVLDIDINSILSTLKEWTSIQPDSRSPPKNIEFLQGTSIVSSIIRMIAYHMVPTLRSSLSRNFPTEIRFEGNGAHEKIINYIEDVINQGAIHPKGRLFIVGHQGSGKTSLAYSLRFWFDKKRSK